jgi:multiphosphoryl transfer protein
VAERWVTVSAPGGLHARLAARIVRVVRGVGARVMIEYQGQRADAGSLTSLLTLGADEGSRVRVLTEGDEAKAALERVTTLLSYGGTARVYRGVGVSPGVGIGRGLLAAEDAGEVASSRRADPEGEIRRLRDALAEASGQLGALEVWAEREIGGASDILRAERELLRDAVWLAALERRIREDGMTAEAAIRSASFDPGMMPPAAEGGPPDGLREVLRDVGRRVARVLAHVERAPVDAKGAPIILVARQVSPSDLLEWPRDRLAGVVAAVGSAQSHATLVARALRVPMVVGVGEALAEALAAEEGPGPMVRVDGTRGLVAVGAEGALEVTGSPTIRGHPTMLSSAEAGRPAILGNADTPEEVRQALAAGAVGIGLVRTERVFFGREAPPDEDEQYAAFEAIGAACPGRPLTLRLADLGGDKAPTYLLSLLGMDSRRWRGAGLLARYPALARPHLRALARVARESRVGIMVPMVATRTEWEAILALWREVARTVGAEVSLNLLVETPAAALDVARFLPEADEVSIGTNDLAALLFGGDRERGPTVSRPALQPVMLRLVGEVIRCAHDRGLAVTVCGEAAGRLPEALVLWGAGVDGLSVSPGRVAALVRAVSALDQDRVREMARDVRDLGNVAQVWARLEEWRRDLASLGITVQDWPQGREGHRVEYNGVEYNEGNRNDLGGGLAQCGQDDFRRTTDRRAQGAGNAGGDDQAFP